MTKMTSFNTKRPDLGLDSRKTSRFLHSPAKEGWLEQMTTSHFHHFLHGPWPFCQNKTVLVSATYFTRGEYQDRFFFLGLFWRDLVGIRAILCVQFLRECSHFTFVILLRFGQPHIISGRPFLYFPFLYFTQALTHPRVSPKHGEHKSKHQKTNWGIISRPSSGRK